jgi:deazaflavin-dependent oxidoreductase (nitroreductase family)
MSESQPSFVRERPGSLLRIFFKVPTYLYRGPVAAAMRARCVLLLTTTGRRSGLPRTTAVSFMEVGGRYVIFAGWGTRANWYQNLLANPEVTLQVGNQRRSAIAEPVQDPARRRSLMLQMRDRSDRCGPPKPLRPLVRLLSGFDYDGDIALAVQQGEKLPVIELVPRTTT